MSAAEFAVLAFTACNILRAIAYFQQMARIAQDDRGAAAISYSAWGLFALSHSTTVGYALTLPDYNMAAIFALNTLCCVAILALTAWRRRQFRKLGSHIAALRSLGQNARAAGLVQQEDVP